MFTKRPRSKTQSETVSDLQGFTSDGIQFNKKRKTTGSNANLKEDNADIDSDEEALYFEQSQLMAANNIAPRGNEPADYGTIELIRLENFMCHPCLEMKFGPFMNFVVGQNGSGKSAVLTALTLCLGAKAAVTNRGGNVKSFIKEGEHMAVVEVHLRNRGDGFRKDVYGETIIIQRTFNRDGVTSYKIKAKSGKVVSTAKKELSDIIDYMSLQVDNPMTVLSQDLARQFLSNSTDEDKYKFFMKGVQLDDLYALYQALKSQQAQIDGVLESKAEDIRELKEDKEAAEKKFKLVQQTDDLRNNVTELLLTHAWAQVSESKLCLETANKKLSDSQRTKEELNMKLENANITVKTWDQKVSQALEAVENSSDSINPLKDEKKELEGRLLSNRKNFEQIQLEERSIYDHLKTAKRNLEKAQHDVDTEKQRLADADNGKLTSLVEEKERLLEERGRLELEINGLDENINVEQNINRENKAKLDELRDKVQKKEASVRGAKDALKQLTSSHSGNLNLYGQNIPKLIEAIGRTSWKAEKPIGPIGLFVKLKDKKWSSIVERQLGRVLTGFITSSLEDKDRLMSLTREYKCANTVYYTSRASFHQGSGGVDPIIGWTQAPRMATSIEEQIKFAEASIAVKDSELGEARGKYTDLEDAISAYQDSLVERRNHKQRNKTEIQRIDDQIEDITQKLEQDNSNTELIRLEAAVETQKHAYVISTGQHNDNLAEKQRLSRIQTELDAEMKDLSAKIDEFETHADSLQNIHNLAIQQKEASVLASAEILRKIEIQDAEISELSNSAEKAEEHLGGQIVEAQKVGAEVRLGADDTTKKIETQLNQLEAEIRKRDARIGASTESIAKDYRTKTEKYKAAREEVTDLEKVHQALQQTFEERMERWGYFRKYISVQSRYQFRFLMSEREFDGKLAFDHKKGILQLRVQPSQQATDTQRNTKTLSGGEKSFSQICLLLALWEAMGSPFRCLDEFDVFMDAVNRGVSMGLIIKAARNSVGKQFILITPQDVSTKGIDETADVRIVRMPDPQRNQTRIQVRR
ncbi:Structural maintenance of chromosomes protein 6 [Orbilia oligospora]|nr:Structural maintenance of chromosomes protein 6 [Orbilia oligospora]